MRFQRHRLMLAAMLMSVLALGLVTACGSTSTVRSAPASPDPLVGTWRHQWLVGNPPPDPPLVITKTGDGYLATFVYHSAPGEMTPSPSPTISIPLAMRSAGVLTGPFRVGTAVNGRAQVVLQSDTGHLLWSLSDRPQGPFGPTEVWVKVSANTAYPTP